MARTTVKAPIDRRKLTGQLLSLGHGRTVLAPFFNDREDHKKCQQQNGNGVTKANV